MSTRPFKIAVVAGEASSDMLGTALINDMFELNSAIEIIAVGGKRIASTAAKVIQDNEVFSVMGLTEVIRHLPRLVKIKNQILKKIITFKPDVFIGIDSPDLNFSMAKSLKKHGIPVIHYVSPSVWAWRPNRIYKMQGFIDYLLTLFPFEPSIYKPTSIQAEFVGHPLAQKIPIVINKKQAKEHINLKERKVLALLPGSRNREIKTLLPIFLAALKRMNLDDQWLIASSNVNADKIKIVNDIAADSKVKIKWVDEATELLKAADFALLGSGTVALEAMLCKTPMVVAYQISPLTWSIVSTFKMMQLPYYSLPNVLKGDFMVPEVMQKDLTAARLSAVCTQVINKTDQSDLIQSFEKIHQTLLPDVSNLAAQKVLGYLEERC